MKKTTVPSARVSKSVLQFFESCRQVQARLDTIGAYKDEVSGRLRHPPFFMVFSNSRTTRVRRISEDYLGKGVSHARDLLLGVDVYSSRECMPLWIRTSMSLLDAAVANQSDSLVTKIPSVGEAYVYSGNNTPTTYILNTPKKGKGAK